MVNSNLHNILNTVSLESQYDAQAKKVLAQKIVLAYIMKNTLEDFKDMNPQEIMPYIEGEPMIGISNDLAEYDEQHELHRFLGALFSKGLTSEERLSIMEEEYHIPSRVLGKEVETMCNLSQGIKEDALAEGREAGIAEGREANLLEQISKKLAKGKSLSQIADECEETEERIRELMKKL
ncbi:uncharacterized protein BN600_01882 [Roseburia sp. CAG:309]|nr:uncharacterized protein BN600_01882 [Roseburia sp. CAG:309]